MLSGFLVLLTIFSQTKVDAPTQTKGLNLLTNSYFSIVTFADSGKVQLLPGPEFSRNLRISNVSVPPNSQSICSREIDGESHPAYEFLRSNEVIFDKDYMYICTQEKRFKRVRLEEF